MYRSDKPAVKNEERIKYLPRPVGAYNVKAFDWDASLLSRPRRSVEQELSRLVQRSYKRNLLEMDHHE